MQTQSVLTADGNRIIFDVVGEGPPLILLHGAGEGHSRRSWHELGYVDRLKSNYKVICIDQRGHGESDEPTELDAYTIDRMGQDVLDVADACGVDQFVLWGFSFGGNIGRYLASKSDRITRFIMVGIPFGPAASGDFREFIYEFKAKWEPIIQDQKDGTLDLAKLEEEDRENLKEFRIDALIAWLTAMLDWGNNEPADLLCPTLWLSGSENPGTMASIETYQNSIQETQVQTHVFEGLNHQQEFKEVDIVFPKMLAFTEA